jgi:tetratricopeptide (TPR) repeat protein
VPKSQPSRQTHYLIPSLKNPNFIGREELLEALKDRLFMQEDTGYRTLALLGLGGIGKTQVALQLAHWVKQMQPDYSVFWVPILSHGSFTQAYSEIAREVGIQESKEQSLEETVKRYLSSEANGKWLMIIDNADDSELVLEPHNNGPSIYECLPQSDGGITLFTTRSEEVATTVSGSDVVELPHMSVGEAADLFRRLLVRKNILQDWAVTEELLEELAYLPLAITHTAAYFNQNRQMSLQKYLGLMRGAEAEAVSLLSREYRDKTRYKDSKNTIMTTWLVSFDQIRRHNKAAEALLSFVAWVEPRGLPQSLLPSTSNEELEHAIGTLCGYAFLVPREQEGIFDMHRLVHLATRVWLQRNNQTEITQENAIIHVGEIFPMNYRQNRDLWRLYMPHALRLLHRTQSSQQNERYDLCGVVGLCLLQDRRFKEAIVWLEELCKWRTAYFAEDDHERLASEHWLASGYHVNRRIKEAIGMLERVVNIRRRILPKDDQSRLLSERDLASAYLDDRRIKEAISIFEYIVEIQRAVLPEDDDQRLDSEHILGRAYFEDGQTQDAIRILENIVERRRATLPKDDHTRLTSEHELANAYLSNRQIKEAIGIFEYIVDVEWLQLAEDDFNRLLSEQMLGIAYLEDRRIKAAVGILEHVAEVQRATLAEDDHGRLDSESMLARVYIDDRRIKEAISILEKVVELQRTILVEDDFRRLTSQHELARAYIENGQIKEAISIIEHVVAVRRVVLSENSPDLLMSEYVLARAYLDDLRIKEATSIIENVVELQRATLAEDDHHLLLSEHELARAYLHSGQIKEAISIFENVVELRRVKLCEDNHTRLTAEHLLAKGYLMDGREQDATALLEHVTRVEERVRCPG